MLWNARIVGAAGTGMARVSHGHGAGTLFDIVNNDGEPSPQPGGASRRHPPERRNCRCGRDANNDTERGRFRVGSGANAVPVPPAAMTGLAVSPLREKTTHCARIRFVTFFSSAWKPRPILPGASEAKRFFAATHSGSPAGRRAVKPGGNASPHRPPVARRIDRHRAPRRRAAVPGPRAVRRAR